GEAIQANMAADSPPASLDASNASELIASEFSGPGSPSISGAFTILRLCLAIFGVLANTVTGVVLTNRKLWSPTSMLLLSLVAYDAVFLLASIPVSAMGVVITTDLETFAVIFGICYPLRFMAQTGSIYTTVTVTIERFLIVFRPLKARGFCTFGKTRRLVVIIFIFSIVFNIPRCFFYQLATSFAPHIVANVGLTSSLSPLSSSLPASPLSSLSPLSAVSTPPGVASRSALCLEAESRRHDADAQAAYYTWLYTVIYELYVSGVFFYLLPYTLIPILNLQLLVAIKQRRDETRRISLKNQHQVASQKPTDMEDGLTMIVLGITVCFVICCVIPAIYNVTQIAEVPPTTKLSTYLLIASDTMLCVNASTDFFFYCLLGRRFRNAFLYLFCTKRYLAKHRTRTGSRYGSRGHQDSYYHSV
ncbi:hypothetical protein EGW08_000482, partial [Elysia chlorotica]